MPRSALDIAPCWDLEVGEGPLVGVSLHSGHDVRPQLISHLALDEMTRLREEDPYADYWTQVCGTRLLLRRSRFEVDMNRPRHEAVCAKPDDCWGLKVWSQPLSPEITEHSLAEHDAFYAELMRTLDGFQSRFGRFAVLDFHTYNHRRNGPAAAALDPSGNPEINVGTGTLNRGLWGPLVDRFLRDLRRFDFMGRTLDVRENVRFRGRYLAQFVHENFPRTGCVLAIEVKKFFMDEWSGGADVEMVKALLEAFRSTVPGLLQELGSR